MFDIYVLSSSSKGNCIYVDAGDCRFLLDVGIPIGTIKRKLHPLGVKLSSIDYAFVTHEHIDHIRGLCGLIDQYDTKVIASNGTLRGIDIPKYNIITARNGADIEVDGLKITCKRVNHDANEPLCFSITNSLGETMLYLTDCGMARYLRFKNHNVYVVESNYDRDILQQNFENHIIDESRLSRANSGMGHLSIDETIDFLQKNIGSKTEHIILTHLSAENANKDNFRQRTSDELFFFNVSVAEEGLNITCGDDPTPF